MTTGLPNADVVYIALIGDTRRLAGLRRLTYRCPERCLLLDAVEVGETVVLHQKRYKYSDGINLDRSSEAGRQRNTYDGREHWMARSYWIGSSALEFPDDVSGVGVAVQCDHVGVMPNGGVVVLSAEAFQSDWSAGHAEVRVRRDGTRFSVQ